MSVFLIVRANVTDWERYRKYTAATPDVIAHFGGEFLARGGRVQTLEGPDESRRVVVIRFPSLEKALQFYNSPEYTAARRLREGAATFELIAVEGV